MTVFPVTVPTGEAALKAASRTQAFTFERLTRGMGVIGELQGVTDGSVDVIAQASVHSSGQLGLVDLGQSVNWLSERVRVRASVENYGEWGMGVYVPVKPRDSWTATGRTLDVQLMGLETVLDHAIGEVWQVTAGDNIADAVAALITGAGESAGALTDTGAVAASTQVFPATDTVLSIINTLADQADCFSLFADGEGQFRLEPALAPADRPVQWLFADAEDSIYVPEWSREQDWWKVPNRVVATTRGDEDAPGLISVLDNDDPDDDLSTVNRGIVTTDDSIIEVEAVDQAALDAIAARTLRSLSSPSASVELEHLLIPLVHNDVVSFVNTAASVDRRFVVQRASFSLSDTGLVKTTLREVAA